MKEKRKRGDVFDYLLLLGTAGVFLLCLCSACFLSAQQYFFSDNVDENSAFSAIITIAALSMVAVPTAIISLRSIRGREIPRLEPPNVNLYYLVILFLLVLILGYSTIENSYQITITGSIIHITAAVIPVAIAILLVIRHKPAVSLRRFWGSLFIGTWIIPLSAFIIELVLMIAGMATYVLGSLGTSQGQESTNLLTSPENWASETLTDNLSALFEKPIIIIAILAFICVLVPIIEESLKSLTFFPILNRKPLPSEAFLSGILGGVGFAFVEVIFLTPAGTDWTQTMFIRGGATMMHTFTAGMTCWGLGQVITYKRWKRFLGAYSLALFMHGLWNVAAIAIGVGMLPTQAEEIYISGSITIVFLIVGIIVMAGLSILATAGLIIIPQRLQSDENGPGIEPKSDEDLSLSPTADEEIQYADVSDSPER
jgi:hypothetical protein